MSDSSLIMPDLELAGGKGSETSEDKILQTATVKDLNRSEM